MGGGSTDWSPWPHVELPPAIRHAAALLDGVHAPLLVRGYLDLLGTAEPARPRGPIQSLMLTRLVPAVYQRLWRPVLGQLVKGPLGPSDSAERELARELLDLTAGEVLVDVACGPGNFTRALAPSVGARGLALGVDASPTMLERAVADTDAGNIAYLRADAGDLPLRPGSVDAIGCFLALHLFDDPFRAVDRMTDALAPGGRIALHTTCARGEQELQWIMTELSRYGGVQLFGREELTDWLEKLGFIEIRQEVHGLMQFVGARRPD
ncbi:MAG TPA: methyltransferase domain-containing protein [Pseudonocardiaceae bacterium]|jgi:SAM-dependent methyltransferase|nr:methyltransferase domain-containing protein [Pseudonocardiaceae bacterium]